jgi:O-antigen/teichoic acid export membrane protein
MAQIFVASLGADFIARGLAAVATILVVRALAPAEFGQIAYALATAVVVGVAVDLGLSYLLVREVSSAPERGPSLLGSVLRLQGLLSVAIFGGGALLAATGTLRGPAEPAVLALGFAVVAANTVTRPFEATLSGYGRAHLVTVAHTVRGVSLVTLTAVAVLVDPTPASALLAALAAEVVGAATIWTLTAGRVAPPSLAQAIDMRSMLRRAVPFALFAGFALLYLRIDTIMLGALSSDDEVGSYGVAVRVVETVVAVPSFFGAAFLATVAQGDLERAGVRTERALRLLLLVCVPLAFALGAVAGPIVQLVGGDDYDRAAEVLVRLSPMIALFGAYTVLANLQIALDRTVVLVWISVGGVALKIALNAWAIPEWGATGAAATVVAAEAAVVVAQWVAARGHVRGRALARWAAGLLVAAVAMTLAGGLLVPTSPFLGLLAGVLAFAVAGRLTGAVRLRDAREAWRSVRGPA